MPIAASVLPEAMLVGMPVNVMTPVAAS